MKLLIISHTPHYLSSDTVHGWGPTIREINYLATIFDQVTHIAPLHPGPPPSSSLSYTSPRIRLIPISPAGGDKLFAKFKILKAFVEYLKIFLRELPRADVVHIRCPANLSLLALMVISLVSIPKIRWVKYAGNWRPDHKEAWSYTLQRWWLGKGLHKGIVTVNGRWPNQGDHIYSFFNPSLTQKELDEAEAEASKQLASPLVLIFVGRLEDSKGAGRVMEIAAKLQEQGIDFELHLLGDGPERSTFEAYVREQGMGSRVKFHGWLPRPALSEFYHHAHFIVFPSASEGWPKVLSEAMAYGAVPLAGAVSSIPQILAATGAGKALPPLDINAFVEAILDYAQQPARWQKASQAGRAAASKFTYEYYLQTLRQTFQTAWGITLPAIKDV